MKKCITLEYDNQSEFEKMVNAYLDKGYEISSTNCGFINSETYNFHDVWHAILIYPIDKEEL